jgi:signal peptidase
MVKKVFKIISNIFLVLVFCVGILVVTSFVKIPGGFKLFTVLSGSMEPTLHTGSIILVKPLQSYATGDIVTRATADPKVTITHRIISKDESTQQAQFETKGDANNSADGEKFSQDKIIGKEFVTIPYFGFVISFAKTQQGIILLIIIPSILIIYDELGKIVKELSRIKKEKLEKKGTFYFENKKKETLQTNVHPRPKKIV